MLGCGCHQGLGSSQTTLTNHRPPQPPCPPPPVTARSYANLSLPSCGSASHRKLALPTSTPGSRLKPPQPPPISTTATNHPNHLDNLPGREPPCAFPAAAVSWMLSSCTATTQFNPQPHLTVALNHSTHPTITANNRHRQLPGRAN